MAIDPLGRDLALVPTFQADEWSARDLVVTPTGRGGLVATGALEARDLGVLEGRQNLAQALILRLLTPVGSLASLGHAAYGSRLYTLVGRRKDATARQLCRLYVLEAVAQEPRVAAVVSLELEDPTREAPDTLAFTLAVRPSGETDPLGLRIEVA